MLPRSLALLAALAASLAVLAAPAAGAAQRTVPEAPYVPTPMEVVERMLAMAAPTPADVVYDLGSGDGRIVIEAARRYGARGVGVELDAALVRRAEENARAAGVADRVRFVRGDLFEADLRPATVVTLYLLSSLNLRLRPRLLEQLRPGARVVSHSFSMGEWKPDSVVVVPMNGDFGPRVYSWTIPARVAGSWLVATADGERWTLHIEQRFQEIGGAAQSREHTLPLEDARLAGGWIEFSLPARAGAKRRFVGRVEGGAMQGTFTDAAGTSRPWSARRVQ